MLVAWARDAGQDRASGARWVAARWVAARWVRTGDDGVSVGVPGASADACPRQTSSLCLPHKAFECVVMWYVEARGFAIRASRDVTSEVACAAGRWRCRGDCSRPVVMRMFWCANEVGRCGGRCSLDAWSSHAPHRGSERVSGGRAGW